MTIRRTRKKRSIGMVSDAIDFYQCDLAILDKLDAYREGDAHLQTDLFMSMNVHAKEEEKSFKIKSKLF